MSDGECRDDFQYVEKRRPQCPNAAPLPSFALQHRRQKQREQEKNVVVAGPDVPDAFAHELEKLPPGTGHRELELFRGMVWREDRALHFALRLEAQQAAMQRIGFKEKRVIQFK